MSIQLIYKDNYLRTVFDVLPSAVFVVDYDFHIYDFNPEAAKLFNIDSDVILRRLCGEIMHCLHAIESEKGCGNTEHCDDCVVKNAVESAKKSQAVYKTQYKMKILNKGDIRKVHMLISASPFEYEDDNFVLLVIEDITEVTKLRRLLPICSSCKKIRNDDNYWEAVADYLKKHEDMEFTHSICPECLRKHYPKSRL